MAEPWDNDPVLDTQFWERDPIAETQPTAADPVPTERPDRFWAADTPMAEVESPAAKLETALPDDADPVDPFRLNKMYYDMWRHAGEPLWDAPELVGGALKQSGAGVEQSVGEALDRGMGYAVKDIAEGDYFSAAVGLVSRWQQIAMGLMLGKEGREELVTEGKRRGIEAREQLAETTKDYSPVQQVVGTAVQSVGASLPGLLTGNPFVAVGAMGAQEYGRSYDEGRAAGLSPEDAQDYAAINGLVEVGTEFLPAKEILTRNPGARQVFAKFLKKEIAGEITAEELQYVNDWAHGLREDISLSEAMHLAALTAASTTLSGGAQGTVITSLNAISDVANARREQKQIKQTAKRTGIPEEQIAGPFETLEGILEQPLPDGLSPEQQQEIMANRESIALFTSEMRREEAIRLGESAGKITTKLVDRLPKTGKVTRKDLNRLLQNGELSKPERKLVQNLLQNSIGDSWRAVDIKAEAMRDIFPLKPVASRRPPIVSMVHRGLALGRPLPLKTIYGNMAGESQVPPVITDNDTYTTVWEAPFYTGTFASSKVDTHNWLSYGHRNYYAHSQGFINNGVRHVVEIQHDLHKDVKSDLAFLSETEGTRDAATGEFVFSPGQRAADRTGLERATAAASSGLQNMQRIAQEEIRREAANGQPVIRFARAPTVAVAEGWVDPAFGRGGDKATLTELKNRAMRGMPRTTGIFKQYQELESWLKENYETEIYTDPHGWEYVEVTIPQKAASRPTTFYSFPALPPGILDTITRGTRAAFRKLRTPVPTTNMDDLEWSLDSYNAAIGLSNNLLQIGYRNPHIKGLQSYIDQTRAYWAKATEWRQRADARVDQWSRLSRQQKDKIAGFLYEVTLTSEQKDRRLNTQEIAHLAKKHNLNRASIALFKDIDGDFRAALDKLYAVAKSEIDQNYLPDSPQAHLRAVAELDKQFLKLRNKHYFPLTRFGKYAVTVVTNKARKIDGKSYSAGEVVYFETFGGVFGRSQMRRGLKDISKKYPIGDNLYSVRGSELAKDDYKFSALSEGTIYSLKNKLGLDAEQREALSDIVTHMSPSQAFIRHMLNRKGTPGFAEDAMRSYAAYFMKFSNHIARMEMAPQMRDSIRRVRRSAGEIRRRTGSDPEQALRDPASKRDSIANWLQDHYDYLMSPPNEWAAVRSIGFLWYLGFMPKSALVNLTQPILVTYPYLAAQYSDVDAVAQLAKAMNDVSMSVVKPGRIEPWLQAMIKSAIQDGFIDESFATDLAAVAEGQYVETLAPKTNLGRTARRVSKYGAWMFQKVEMLNRRMTFIAAARLAAKKHGMNDAAEYQRVYEEARKAVELTQYEYARWNRPKFMRGKASVVFLFYNYIQNTLFFLHKVPGRGRALLVLMMVAGLTGIPFAEDVLDLLDALFTKFPEAKKRLGLGDDPMSDLRQDAREYLADVTNPEVADLLLHGVTRRFGLMAAHALDPALSPFGLQVPNTDISRSLSLGRVVPGIPQAVRGLAQDKDGDALLRDLATDTVGAAGAIPLRFLQGATSNTPDDWKRLEYFMPRVMAAISSSTRIAARGAETDLRGAEIVPYDVTDPQTRVDLVVRAMGFPLNKETTEKDMRWVQREHAMFYSTRRSLVIQDVYHALQQGDKEAFAAAMAALNKFNATAPPGLHISGSTLIRSIKSRSRNRIKTELGMPASRGMFGEYAEIEDSFPRQRD